MCKDCLKRPAIAGSDEDKYPDDDCVIEAPWSVVKFGELRQALTEKLKTRNEQLVQDSKNLMELDQTVQNAINGKSRCSRATPLPGVTLRNILRNMRAQQGSGEWVWGCERWFGAE